MKTYYLSLGSNIHPRHHYINEACRLLEERCGTVLRRSADYYSMPVGYESEHEYLNICLSLQTSMSPMELLLATQQIERDLGRTQKSYSVSPTNRFPDSPHYQDRTIDIDLLQAFDDGGKEVCVQSAALTLPHPRMQERAFVMCPLRTICR